MAPASAACRRSPLLLFTAVCYTSPPLLLLAATLPHFYCFGTRKHCSASFDATGGWVVCLTGHGRENQQKMGVCGVFCRWEAAARGSWSARSRWRSSEREYSQVVELGQKVLAGSGAGAESTRRLWARKGHLARFRDKPRSFSFVPTSPPRTSSASELKMGVCCLLCNGCRTPYDAWRLVWSG